MTFSDNLSRLRKGHGARNMASVRHFALNLVRTLSEKGSIKFDTLIAAQALVRDLTLVTHAMREFGRVAGLRTEDWESAE